MNTTNAITEITDRDFVLTRVFDAPRERVFAMWADPARLAEWWGPKVFTTPVCEIDFRVGGAFRIVMRAPDGTDYPIKGVHLDIVEPERIVASQDLSEHPDSWHDLINPNRPKGAGRPAFEAVQSVFFEEEGGRTKLTIHARFESPEIRDAMVKMGMNEGWNQSLDRLDEALKQ